MSDPVHARFMAYSGFGDKTQAGQMDGKLFAKLCKETGIIDKKCTATDVDLIFARAKPKGGRKLDFGAFTDACVMLAEKRFAKTLKDEGKEAAVRKLYELIAGSAGPQANAVSAHKQHIRRRKSEPACNNNKTKADAVRFHDDKSTYTGVHAKGGPSTVDNPITLSNLLDRSEADARGIKKA